MKGLKGKVVTKPHDIPGVGRAAVVSDPTGAPLGLLKAASPDEVKAVMEKAAPDAATGGLDKKKDEQKKAPEKAPTP